MYKYIGLQIVAVGRCFSYTCHVGVFASCGVPSLVADRLYPYHVAVFNNTVDNFWRETTARTDYFYNNSYGCCDINAFVAVGHTCGQRPQPCMAASGRE